MALDRYHESNVITLGTLAAETAIFATELNELKEDFMTLLLKVWPAMLGLSDGEGPVIFGICDGVYFVGDVANHLKTTGPVNPKDTDGAEIAKRQVFPLYSFFSPSANVGPPHPGEGLTWKPPGGRQIWSDEGNDGDEAWYFFAYNAHPGVALTTGSSIVVIADHFGKWLY